MPEIKKFNQAIIQYGTMVSFGFQGTVYKVTHDTQGIIAVKIFTSPSIISKSDKKEIEHLINHNHNTYVVRFLGLVVDEWDNCIGHVTEFMNGSLADVIHGTSGYKLRQAYSWIEDAAYGLSFLHEEKIVHRDVKPLNMLLSDNKQKLKICDLGLSRHYEDITSSSSGTYMYMSPETITSQKNVGFPTDVWSLGVSIWEIVKRRYPYSDKQLSVFERNNRIAKGELVPRWVGNSDKEVGQLLSRMWQMEPEIRPTMLEVRKFFTDKKETCSDRSIRSLNKTKTKELSSGMETLSIDEPSTSSSANSSIETPTKKTKASGKYFEPWLETSRSFIAMSAHNPELNEMCVKIEDAAEKMRNLHLKRTLAAVNKCHEYVKRNIAAVLAYMSGPGTKVNPKDTDAIARFELLKSQTISVAEAFEAEVQKKVNSLSQKESVIKSTQTTRTK